LAKIFLKIIASGHTARNSAGGFLKRKRKLSKNKMKETAAEIEAQI
jgi:hypothetical protein